MCSHVCVCVCRWLQWLDNLYCHQQVVQNFQDVKHTFGADRGQITCLPFGDMIVASGIQTHGKSPQETLNDRFDKAGLAHLIKMRGTQLHLETALIEEVNTLRVACVLPVVVNHALLCVRVRMSYASSTMMMTFITQGGEGRPGEKGSHLPSTRGAS